MKDYRCSKTNILYRKNNDSSVFELLHMPGAVLNNKCVVSLLVFTPVLDIDMHYYVLSRKINGNSQSFYNILMILQLVGGKSSISKAQIVTSVFHCLSSSFFSNTVKTCFWFSKCLLSAYCVPGLVLGWRCETMLSVQ